MSISTTPSPQMTRYLFVRVISVEGEGKTFRWVADGVGCDVRKNTYFMDEDDGRRRD